MSRLILRWYFVWHQGPIDRHGPVTGREVPLPVARGAGMAERQMRSTEQARASTEQYIRTVASSSPAQEISQAKTLLDSGTISAGEFEAIKSRALGGAQAGRVTDRCTPPGAAPVGPGPSAEIGPG